MSALKAGNIQWIELRPRDPATAGMATLRFAGGAIDRSYFREENGQHYKAGVVSAPRFAARVGFGRDGFTGQTVPQASRIQIAPAEAQVFESLAGYFWKDAEISIDAGPENAAAFPRLFTGTVVGDSIADGVFTLTIADLSTRLDKPVCDQRFAGNGGIEGGEEAEGRTKRRSWGHVFNVEGRLLDPANSIYEFGDPAVPLTSFSALRDKGRTGPFSILAWQGSIAATFAALQASAPAQGGGVVAPSIACAKWWTEPSGPLTADFVGTPGTGGSMAAASLIDAVSARFDGPAVTDRATANALRPAAAGLHVGDENTTGAQVIDRLALGSSLIWIAAPEGIIRLLPWTFQDGGAEVLHGQFIGRERAYAPHYRRRVGFQANNRRHSESEIAESILGSTIIFDDGTTVPADKVFYQGGPEPVSVDDLRPAEPGATYGAPGDSPLGDDDNARSVVDAMRQNSIMVGQVALENSTWRVDVDEILQIAPDLTLRQLVEQLGVQVNGINTWVTLRRSVDTDGNAEWAFTAQNSTGAITGIRNLLTGEGIGKLAIVADILEIVDPEFGNPIPILSYGLDNRLMLGDVFITKLEVGSVKTTNIDLNQVVEAPEWEASFGGATGDNLGAASLGVWAEFGFSGQKCSMAFTGLPSGATVQVQIHFNAQRTGSDNDRVNFRLKRIGPGGTTYHPVTYLAGAPNFPVVLTWLWRDTITVTGDYEYRVEYQRVTDRLQYFNCHAIATAGKR